MGHMLSPEPVHIIDYPSISSHYHPSYAVIGRPLERSPRQIITLIRWFTKSVIGWPNGGLRPSTFGLTSGKLSFPHMKFSRASPVPKQLTFGSPHYGVIASHIIAATYMALSEVILGTACMSIE
jgi:hypothetical protein